MISGKPVWSATSRTATPLCVSSCAVPPVDRISMLRLARACASSMRPVLSDTERSARRTGGGMGFIPQTPRRGRHRWARGSGAGKPELLQFLAQGAAVDAENACRTALVALRVIEHDAKQRLLDLAQYQVVEMGRPVTVQTGEVIAQGALGMIAQRQFPPFASGDNGFASPRPLLCGHCETPQREKPFVRPPRRPRSPSLRNA